MRSPEELRAALRDWEASNGETAPTLLAIAKCAVAGWEGCQAGVSWSVNSTLDQRDAVIAEREELRAKLAAAEKRIADLCDTTTNGIPEAVEQVRGMVVGVVEAKREERERIIALARERAKQPTSTAVNFASGRGVHSAALETFAYELEIGDGE